MKKRLVIALTLLALLSTYKPSKLFLSNKFNIKEIKIENNFILKDEKIRTDLLFLYEINLIFLKTADIKKIYESKRWDLEIYNKKIIKLPVKNYIESLKNFMNLRKKNNFDNFKVFDYRVANQLILK